MHRLFTALVAPLLDAVDPDIVIETGAGRGLLTRLLLTHSERATVHAVDPAPAFDAAQTAREHGSRLILHADTSTAVLRGLPPADLVILDGDPNYATVAGDLAAVASAATTAGTVPPVVILHHTEWPYGRRDGYHDAARLGADSLNEPVDAGVRPGHERPDEDGLRLVPTVAASDRGERNGVRRALDAFAVDHPQWHQVNVPGLHGVAVLCPPERVAAHPDLAALFTQVGTAAFLADQVKRVELERITTLLATPTVVAVEAAEQAQAAARTQLDHVAATTSDLQRDLADERAAVARLTAELEVAERIAARQGLSIPAATSPLAPALVDRAGSIEGGSSLVAEAAAARGELQATLRELDRVLARGDEQAARAAAAEGSRDTALRLAERDGAELDRARDELARLSAAVAQSEGALTALRDEHRTARGEAARLASELDHARAQVIEARTLLARLVARRGRTRRQRVAAAFSAFRAHRRAETAALEAAVSSLAIDPLSDVRPEDRRQVR